LVPHCGEPCDRWVVFGGLQGVFVPAWSGQLWVVSIACWVVFSGRQCHRTSCT